MQVQSFQKRSKVTSSSPITADSSEVNIRSYHSSDYQDCREIFTQGMEQLIRLVTRVVFPRYCWLLAVLSVFALLAAFKYSLWIVPLYIFACAVVLSLLYVDVYLECWEFINSCLASDLKDIDKSYMSNDGSHMWVAEWNGKVVGMVGLIHNESHKPGVAELQRMSVSPVCRRMGIARKLLDELLIHAKDQRFEKLVLTTTSAQTPAIRLYKKYGFKLIAVFPYPQKILRDLQYSCFDLRLND
ncbi:N-acetylaspartate synthetase [Desmophyllum pertusum]|uniref:N-acetylaspartate synthetase n=1 Tax=Desmophyllum pertusum TaxID=174260 RepID=A0A9W9YWF5_9CNID|nr:N-acetylaspartate synthetase [Desmophyllum pertusum]